MSDWYYTRAGQRQGPVTQAALTALLFNGEVAGEDLVWTTGLAQWQKASATPQLFENAGPAAQPAAAGAVPRAAATPAQPVAAVAYYSAGGGLPQRAAGHLRTHAPPSGDTGHWPLADIDVADLMESERLRKRIRSAAGMYRALFGLYLIAAVIGGFAGVINLATARRTPGTAEIVGFAVAVLINGAFAAFFALCGRYTLRNHAWPGYVVASLTGVSVLVLVVIFGIGATASASSGSPEIFGLTFAIAFGLLIAGAIIFAAVRGSLAVPAFRRRPAWTQEALVAAKL